MGRSVALHGAFGQTVLLSVFHSIYAFIRKHYLKPVPLWPSAREEIQHFTAALILMRADWWLPWKNEVVCTDASPYGYGVCGAVWPQGAASSVARIFFERSRFKMVAQAGAGARSRFFAFNAEKLSHEELSDVLAGEPSPEWAWEVDSGFPEIDASLLRKSLFTPLADGAYSHQEDILVREPGAFAGT